MKRLDKTLGENWLASVPELPGVYFFYDNEGQVIYVGKAINLRRRLRQYQQLKAIRKNRKSLKIVRSVARLTWQVCASHLDALLTEVRFIQKLEPQFNVVAKLSKRYPFIALQIDGTRAILAVRHVVLPDDTAQYFGSFRSRLVTIEGFFALSRLLTYIGHREPGKQMAKLPRMKGDYLFGFRCLPQAVLQELSGFLRGESENLLQTLFFSLLEHKAARHQAHVVEEDLLSLKMFYEMEASFVAKAIAATAYHSYPVPQEDRDPLGICYRQQSLWMNRSVTA